MQTNILMVYPKIPVTFWSNEYLIRVSKFKSVQPPLGLLTIASMLPNHYDVKLLDLNTANLTDDDLEHADLVFISAMMVQKESFAQVVSQCRKKNKCIVAGGPYPTASHQDIQGVDHFVLNEGEVTLPTFLSDYENGCAQKIYQTDTKPDLVQSPVPRFDLIDLEQYALMPLQFSRGCPYNCEFCDIIAMFGRTMRTKAVHQFIRELNYLFMLGYRGTVFIVDDNFIGARKVVKELLRKMIAWQKSHGYPFIFFTQVSMDAAYDDELLALLRDARFYELFLGIETPSSATLSDIRKNQNLKMDMYESIRKINQHGIEVMGGFIVGFDTDPEDIFDAMISFVQKAGIPQAMVGLLGALPNTELYHRLAREGRLLGESTGDNLNLETNIVTVMPRETLIAGYEKVIAEIYTPEKYYERVLSLIRRFPKHNPHHDFVAMSMHNTSFFLAPRLGEIPQLISVCMKVAANVFIAPHGWALIKFLIRVVRYNYRYVTFAVYLAFRGHHYFKVAQDIHEMKTASHSQQIG